MKFLTFFVAILSTSVFIACEFVRPLPSKDIHDQSLSSRQLAQSALADLADTAAELAFVDLANAASELSETLAIDDGTSVEPMFSKLTKLADAATILEHAFTQEGCIEEWCIGEYQIGLHTLSKTSVSAVKAYTIRDADYMELALHDIVEGLVSTEKILQQLPAGNAVIPFAFGYGLNIDLPEGNYYDIFKSNNYPPYKLGIITVLYDNQIRPMTETSTAVNEFLTNIGYKATKEGLNYNQETINLGSDVDPLLLTRKLVDIPGVERVLPHPIPMPDLPPWLVPPSPDSFIINRLRKEYNEAWCQGNIDAIDSILTDESELDFFNYAFVRNLANVYAEEIPEIEMV